MFYFVEPQCIKAYSIIEREREKCLKKRNILATEITQAARRSSREDETKAWLLPAGATSASDLMATVCKLGHHENKVKHVSSHLGPETDSDFDSRIHTGIEASL